MSQPVFLHVMSNGDLWIGNHPGDVPTGTVTGTYKFTSGCAFQKIGTLSGTISSSLAASNTTGKNPSHDIG